MALLYLLNSAAKNFHFLCFFLYVTLIIFFKATFRKQVLNQEPRKSLNLIKDNYLMVLISNKKVKSRLRLDLDMLCKNYIMLVFVSCEFKKHPRQKHYAFTSGGTSLVLASLNTQNVRFL